MLNPAVRALGPVLPLQWHQAVTGTSLPFSQGLGRIWPHRTGLIAAVILLFVAANVRLQRQGLRA